jgi:hypothetical protein
MFLMRTLRWATALSTVNCWLSEVIRLTWVAMVDSEVNGEGEGGDWSGGVQVRVGVFRFPLYTRVHPFATAHQIISVTHVLFWSFVWAVSCVPARILRNCTDSCTADRAPQPAKLFENVFGQVRTATKRAGGVTRNHGGSAGRRLGVKKFTGRPPIKPTPPYMFLHASLQMSMLHRGISSFASEGRSSTLDSTYVETSLFVARFSNLKLCRRYSWAATILCMRKPQDMYGSMFKPMDVSNGSTLASS